MKTIILSLLLLVLLGLFNESSGVDRNRGRGMKKEKKGLKHHMRKGLMVDERDFLRSKFPRYKKGHCLEDCPVHYVCVTEDGEQSKCIKKKELKESRLLFRKHMRQMRRQNRNERRRMRYDRFQRRNRGGFKNFMRKPLKKGSRGYKKLRKLQAHMNGFNVKHATLSNKKVKPMDESKALLNNLADVQTLLEKNEDSQGHPICTPRSMNDLRTRIQGWFVVMHEEQREKHHSMKHHDKRSKRSVPDAKLGESKQGKCKCLKSVMWALHHFDKDSDHHLSESEVFPIQKQNKEVCLNPLMMSCNRDNDPRLSKEEWCCCFAEDEPPCAKKVEKLGPMPMIGAFIPKCTAEGYYERMQCHSSTGYCWCSDLNGNEIKGSRLHMKNGQPECEKKYNALGQPKKMKGYTIHKL